MILRRAVLVRHLQARIWANHCSFTRTMSSTSAKLPVVEDVAMLIGGERVRDNGKVFDVLNPFDGSVCGKAPEATREDLNHAVEAARAAFPSWSKTKWEDRQNLVLACAKVLGENQKRLTGLLALEQGKGLPQAGGEIMGAMAWLKMAASKKNPDHVFRDTPKEVVYKRYAPIGVVGCIVPWNFPVILIFFKVSQALMAGCTIVLKPSEHTPLTTLVIGELLNQVLPKGVFNVISGENVELGKWLCQHPQVDKISFTGSTATGKLIMKSAADQLKRVTLELGGNDPAIVLGDVDPKKVAPYLFRGAFGNSGQICMAIKRMYVQDTIFDSFCKEIVQEAEKSKWGNQLEKGTLYGPVNNAMQYKKVRELLVDAIENGAEVIYGKVPPPVEETKGFMFPPVILKAREDMRIVREEQFGPVLPLLSFKTEEEAIEKANDTEYGLGASVWTSNIEKGTDLASRIHAGTTWVNNHGDIIDELPFGGAKSSGIGHEGGDEGLMAFLQLHVVKVKKPQNKL